MEFVDAMKIAKGTTLVLVKSYDGKVPVGTRWTAIQPVDVGDLAFVTASALPGQAGIGANANETLPSEYWEVEGTASAVEALSNGYPVAPVPEIAPAKMSSPPPPSPVSSPTPRRDSPVLLDPAPWDVEDGEVADRFRACAPNSEIARRFFAAYFRVHPPFDDEQLLRILAAAAIPEGIPWSDPQVANMLYMFNEVNGLDHDPIVFDVNPILRQAVDMITGDTEKPKKRGRRSRAEIEATRIAQAAAGQIEDDGDQVAADQFVEPPGVVASVPPGVCDAERKLQGLPPHEPAAYTPHTDPTVGISHELAGAVLSILSRQQRLVRSNAMEALDHAVGIVRAALRA